MTAILIRHGEPDYSQCEKNGYIGHGHDLAPLTEKGIAQATAAADNPLLDGAELIVSSPYTRALQTAAILSRIRGLELRVEVNLHEWMPDLTFQYKTGAEAVAAHQDFNAHGGAYPTDADAEPRKWETMEMVRARATACLDKYQHHHKILVVAHGILMSSLLGTTEFAHCSAHPLERP